MLRSALSRNKDSALVVKLPAATKERFRTAAAYNGRSMSSVVQEFVLTFAREHEETLALEKDLYQGTAKRLRA